MVLSPFQTINLRFRAVGRESIEIYDVTTGERLLTPDELKERAIVESERADTESKRAIVESERADAESKRAIVESERADAESKRALAESERADDLAKQLRELKEEYGISTDEDGASS